MVLKFEDSNRIIGTLIVESENTVIKEDVGHVGMIEEEIIDNLVGVTLEMVEFIRQDKVEFFYNTIKDKLSVREIEELIGILKDDEEN